MVDIAIVIPGQPKGLNYDVQLHIGESRDSPMRYCASEVRASRAPE
jgi:hypothetical protein